MYSLIRYLTKFYLTTEKVLVVLLCLFSDKISDDLFDKCFHIRSTQKKERLNELNSCPSFLKIWTQMCLFRYALLTKKTKSLNSRTHTSAWERGRKKEGVGHGEKESVCEGKRCVCVWGCKRKREKKKWVCLKVCEETVRMCVCVS
jgi:hypothetical protein